MEDRFATLMMPPVSEAAPERKPNCSFRFLSLQIAGLGILGATAVILMEMLLAATDTLLG
jgi:hypothetical protein